MKAGDWNALLGRPMDEREFFSDEEAAALSGVAPPSLRRLQSGGAISATRAPREYGGYVRLWQFDQVARASVASDMQRYIGWKYEKIAAVLRVVSEQYWRSIINTSMPEPFFAYQPYGGFERGVPLVDKGDWYLEVLCNALLILNGPDRKHPKDAPNVYQGKRYLGFLIGETEVREVDMGKARRIEEQMTYRASLNISVPIRRADLRRRRGGYLEVLHPEDIPVEDLLK